MSQAIVIKKFGGPEVLSWQEVQVPAPAALEVQVENSAIGLNFIDTYHRSGLYPLELPSGLGLEAAGKVIACGADVHDFKPGDRVAYTSPPPGAYAERRNCLAANVVHLPADIDERTAAAVMLKGLTAWYLLKRSYAAKRGDTVLLYAAAGGVGQLVVQWAASLGVRVIGVVGNQEKAARAKALGCSAVVLADDKNFVATVTEHTGGEGVAAVYDSVGKDTFFQSLDCLRPHGTMVTFGNASGAVDPFSPLELARRGSLFLTRPVLFDFIRKSDDLRAAAAELFAVIASGDVKVEINQTWPLAQAADAHRALEARKTTGSTLLLPE